MSTPSKKIGVSLIKGKIPWYFPIALINLSCSESAPYLPSRTESLRVTLGIDEKKTTDIPTGQSVKLGKPIFFISIGIMC